MIDSVQNCKEKQIFPFLKWAGGKRWLVQSRPDIFPIKFNTYIEPFLGSGAVYFKLQPGKAILSDTNSLLIDTYQAIKDNWRLVWRYLQEHQDNHSKEHYYKIREMIFKSRFRNAAKFIYLNRTCWNGLYRVNLNGKFNVPIGTKNNVILSTDDFDSIARSLAGATLLNTDFQNVIDLAKTGDFLFVDPPYTVKHKNNGFLKYNENLFSWEDQIRLRDSLVRAKERGVCILVTNADHESIEKIYKNDFKLEAVDRMSVIAAKSMYRRKCEELLISNRV